MRIDNVFAIDAPADRVWSALLDLERVAPCMPGAQIEGRVPDIEEAYQGRFRIKVGPVSAAYRGRIEIASRDDVSREVVLRGSGSDTGGGTATATISSRVLEQEGTSEVHMTTDLDVTGRLAQFGGRSSLSQSVADRVVGQFAERLRQELSGESTATAVPGVEDATDRPAGGRPEPDEAEALDAMSVVRDVVGEQLRQPVVVAALAAFGLGVLVGVAGRDVAGRRR